MGYAIVASSLASVSLYSVAAISAIGMSCVASWSCSASKGEELRESDPLVTAVPSACDNSSRY